MRSCVRIALAAPELPGVPHIREFLLCKRRTGRCRERSSSDAPARAKAPLRASCARTPVCRCTIWICCGIAPTAPMCPGRRSTPPCRPFWPPTAGSSTATTSARWRCACRPATRCFSSTIRCRSAWRAHRSASAQSGRTCPGWRPSSTRNSNSGSRNSPKPSCRTSGSCWAAMPTRRSTPFTSSRREADAWLAARFPQPGFPETK